jgi:DNA polymerase-3 subunit epsilon
MKLTRPIVFFDLETTGTDIKKDRIVQIAAIKYNPDENISNEPTLKRVLYINPKINIPDAAKNVHGISNEDVADKKTFKEVAEEIYDFFNGCDLGGYNCENFDIPLLSEEFSRCGIDFPNWEYSILDVYKLERKLKPMSLSKVYERYTGNALENSHDALADINATVSILEHQLNQSNFENTAQIDDYCQGEKKRFDISNKFFINKEGIVCWNFGKYFGQNVFTDQGYLDWFMKQDMPSSTRLMLENIMVSNNA